MTSPTGKRAPKRRAFRKRNSPRGFTLLETTIVIVIILVVFVGSVPYFGKFFGTVGLNAAARDIATVLKTARSFAVTKRAVYNTVFDTSATPNRYYITDDQKPAAQIGKGYALPAGITIAGITFSSSGKDSYKASFKPSGVLSTTETEVASKSVWIRRSADEEFVTEPAANFRRISVDNITGRVKIDEEKPSR